MHEIAVPESMIHLHLDSTEEIAELKRLLLKARVAYYINEDDYRWQRDAVTLRTLIDQVWCLT